jgi:hypothetical protein
MLLKLPDGTVLTEAIVLYPQLNLWFIPLGEVSNHVGVAVTVDIAKRSAAGSVLNRFELAIDTDNCEMTKAGVKLKYVCELAKIFEGDLYIESELLRSWLEMKFEINTFTSEVTVVPSFLLPIQERAERERRAKMLLRGGSNYDPGYPIHDLPRKKLDGFNFDQQISGSVTKSEVVDAKSIQQESFISGEVLGFEASGFYGSSNDSDDQVRGSLLRRSLQPELLGPLHAREIHLLYHNLHSLPVIGGAAYGLGAAVSNFPLDAPDSYSSQTLQGDLPSGWEVELYQNETLVNRQISGADNRYTFNDVQLFYGLNRFKLIFYGPQGQRTESVRTVNVAPQLNPPGVTNYRAAYAKIEPGVISSASDERTQFRVDSSLLFGLTGHLAFQRMIAKNELLPQDYSLAGLSASLGPVAVNTTAVSSRQGGRALEVSSGTILGNSNFGVTHTVLDDFSSDLFIREVGRKATSASRIELAAVPFSSIPLRLTLQPSRTQFDNGTEREEVLQRTSLVAGRVLWNNEITKRFGDDKSLSGLFSANLMSAASQWRLNTNYTQDKLQSISVDVQRTTKKYNVGVTGSQFFTTESYAEFLASVGRQFKQFTFNWNIGAGTNESWSVGAVLSYSKAYDPYERRFASSATASTNGGNISVIIFHDKNRNGKFDSGDVPLPNIRLRNAQQDVPGQTDENGRMFLTHLVAMRPADLSVVTESLIDPYQKPVEPGARFFPRIGKTLELEIPVQSFSDFSGVVEFPDHPVRGIKLILTNETGEIVATTTAESDGFFVFERVPPGQYRVSIHGLAMVVPGAVAAPIEYNLKAAEEGDSLSGLLFRIHGFHGP